MGPVPDSCGGANAAELYTVVSADSLTEDGRDGGCILFLDRSLMDGNTISDDCERWKYQLNECHSRSPSPSLSSIWIISLSPARGASELDWFRMLVWICCLADSWETDCISLTADGVGCRNVVERRCDGRVENDSICSVFDEKVNCLLSSSRVTWFIVLRSSIE